MAADAESQANAGRRGPDRPHARPVPGDRPDPDRRRPAGRAPRPDQRPLQILGAIAAAERPQPVAWLARDLGANRQNVQRIVNDLSADGLVAFETNPHHRRAQLVVLTDKGKRAFDAAMDLQAPWVNELADGLSVRDVATVRRVVTALRRKLGG